MFWNCFPSLREELETLLGPDELLAGKDSEVFRGKCIALPDVPAYIVKPFAPQTRYVQLMLESLGIRNCRKANSGGGSIVKAR